MPMKLPSFDNIRRAFRDNEEFAPKNAPKFIQGIKRSTKPVGDLGSATALDAYIDARASQLSDFENIKLHQDKTLGEILKDASKAAEADPDNTATLTAIDDIKSNIAQALSVSTDLAEKHQKFNEHITNLAERNQARALDNVAIADELQSYRHTIPLALDQQLKGNKQNINNLFADETFIEKLKMIPGITDTDIKQLQQSMSTTLDETGAKAKESFDQTLQTDVAKAHEQEFAETRRLHILAYHAKNNVYVREALIKWSQEQQRLKNLPTTLSTGIDQVLDDSYDDINAADFLSDQSKIPYLTTPSGTKFQISKSADGINISTTLDLPPYLFNMGYYKHPSNKPQVDLDALAAHVKETGADSITTTISLPRDEDYAMELGRKAYSAALAAGFSDVPANKNDPESKAITRIKINVNGKDKTFDELFANHPKAAKKAMARGEQYKKDNEAIHRVANEPKKTRPGRSLPAKVEPEQKHATVFYKNLAAAHKKAALRPDTHTDDILPTSPGIAVR